MTELLDEQPSMADSDTSAPGTSGGPDAGPDARSVWVRFVVAVVLAAIVVASLALLGARLASHSGGLGSRISQTFRGGGDEGGDLPQQRAEAMSQARLFALRINTYGPQLLKGKTMPAYRSQVDAVITDKLKAAFEKNAVLADDTVSQTKVRASAQVYATGVASITDSSATVLVAGELSFAYPTKAGSTTYGAPTPEPFRWDVQLKKVDGAWLVDDFGPSESAPVDSSSGSTAGGQQ